MGTRLALQTLLDEFVVPEGGRAYFQSPPAVLMVYPAIRYERNYSSVIHANNRPYGIVKRYSVTVIHEDPDSTIPDKIEMLPMSAFDRHYEADELHHTIFDLYF